MKYMSVVIYIDQLSNSCWSCNKIRKIRMCVCTNDIRTIQHMVVDVETGSKRERERDVYSMTSYNVYNQWNRNPRPQLEPQITSLEKYIINSMAS